MKNSFQTKKAAFEFLASISWLYSHTNDTKFSSECAYCLSHGEYSKPDYMPRRYKDGWAISADYFYHQGALNAPKSGRIDDEKFNHLFVPGWDLTFSCDKSALPVFASSK